MKYEEGHLWNYINQGDATKVCRNMYTEDKYGVISDLVNSYMWDTAVVYIQKMGNTNYANANRDTTGNTMLKNTGTTGDEKCHIFDMAGNCWEWTTEYNSRATSSTGYPCIYRGGVYANSSLYTAYRNQSATTRTSSPNVVFRPGLYVK